MRVRKPSCPAAGWLVVALTVQAALGVEQKVQAPHQSSSGASAHDYAADALFKGELPILVITDSRYAANRFGCYLVEILRSEGLVEFEQVERSALTALAGFQKNLSTYRVVLLAEMDLSDAEERLLRKYVAGGGVLIAMRPDADLADLFGIRVDAARPERLIQHFAINSQEPLAMGIVQEPLQYHGEAAKYALVGAAPLAFFRDKGDNPPHDPAVSINRHDKGSAVAFAFDLAKSVVLMRQGNPEWKNTEGDNMPGYRAMDMFARTDGRKLFDRDRLPIPQADEKQRFLANLVIRLAEKPLPRMSYLPAMHKAIVVNTGDAEDSFGPRIAPVLDACASYGGAYTVYLRHGGKGRGIEKTTVEQEAAWRAAGHETAVHFYGEGIYGVEAYDVLHKAYGEIVADLKKKFGHGSRTARNHGVGWTGWVDMAAIEAEFGTGMDMNYCHYILDNPLEAYGYFNGTGLPQRFIDEQGRILPIYQTTTHWLDEWFANEGLGAEQALGIMTAMLDAADAGYYSAFVNLIHPPRYDGSAKIDKITPIWPGKLWAYCRDKGIPSWSAEMLLDFVEARNNARFDNLAWRVGKKGSELFFTKQCSNNYKPGGKNSSDPFFHAWFNTTASHGSTYTTAQAGHRCTTVRTCRSTARANRSRYPTSPAAVAKTPPGEKPIMCPVEHRI